MQDPKKALIKDLICCCIASVSAVSLAQFMIGVKVLSMGAVNFCMGFLIVFAVILLFYAIFKMVTPSIFICSTVFMVMSTINVYVYNFRSRLFEPLDVFSAKTAMEVLSNYSLRPVPKNIVTGWIIYAAVLALIGIIQFKYRTDAKTVKRLPIFALCLAFSAVSLPYANNLETCHWYRDGVLINGYILDFASKFKEITVPRPANYSAQKVDELAQKYAADAPETAAEELPNIIVIMDEAYSDISILGDFSVNMPVSPFISSLEEDTVKGYSLASIFGGNTSNTEYEFLTGNSLAWLSLNVVPYQQYIRGETFSMASYLKSAYGYKCIAMHPYLAGAWNRPAAYSDLGFDESIFIDRFPCRDFIRKFVSDREMFEYLIQTYEANKSAPLFIFGVSMQNHGGYDYEGENYEQTVFIGEPEKAFADAEQYLTLINETDKAVENLVSYLKNADEKVVIAFFGDHQPKLAEGFYEAIGSTGEDLDSKQKYYQVPFFIWANYDIQEADTVCTSMNYLSSYVYEAAGIALPPYSRFLKDMEAAVPSINANGYYSVENGCFLPFAGASGEEKAWLNQYEMLQYNNLFDKKNLNSILFPLPGGDL